MNYSDYDTIVSLHHKLIEAFGGLQGIRDEGILRSAIERPRMSAFGADLYPTLSAKAAALAFSLTKNHAFIDGNKRIGQAAMEQFLLINGYEIAAEIDEQEKVFLSVADGSMTQEELVLWIIEHTQPFQRTRLA